MRRYIRKSNDINIINSFPAENRGENKKKDNPKNKKKKIKFDFKKKKENTLRSLNEVEHFLSDFKCFSRYIKLYFLLK